MVYGKAKRACPKCQGSGFIIVKHSTDEQRASVDRVSGLGALPRFERVSCPSCMGEGFTEEPCDLDSPLEETPLQREKRLEQEEEYSEEEDL